MVMWLPIIWVWPKLAETSEHEGLVTKVSVSTEAVYFSVSTEAV